MSLLLVIFALCSGSFLSVLVGFVGARHKIGFGWTFLLSVIFTPLVGLIFALISDPLPDGERKWGCLGTVLAMLVLIAFVVFSLLFMTMI